MLKSVNDRLYEAFTSMASAIAYFGLGIYMFHNSVDSEGILQVLNIISGISLLCIGVFLYYMTYKKTLSDESKRIIINDD